MRIDLVSYRTASLASAAPSLLSEWRVGAILQAVAVRDAAGQLWLELGDQRLPARIASGDQDGPQDGEKLQVRVLRNHPVLALETLSSKTAESEAVEQTVTADALRRFIPRQESPALMLANLAWLAQGKNAAQLPKEVVDAAAQLWRSLPDARTLQNPAQLQAAIERSGTFLESNLAASASGKPNADVTTDIKALMLELSRVLRDNGARPALARSDVSAPAPLPTANGALSSLPNSPATFSLLDAPSQQLNELSRQTDGALARLTTVQLANNSADPSNPALLIELPVRVEDRASVLRLRIERDGASSKQEAEAQSWSVEAAMDLGASGSLHARVSLQGHRIGVQIRASSPSVVESLAAQRGTLESMLRNAGLEVDRVVCLHGMPATDTGVRPTRLVDVRA
ncbi:MAG TPA: flagellar hook-length control protein FliK [Steroidobacteraceae bacterium]|nr:flagellar hook-length control protein FliK [Steroidobacteraceae bacterium]